MREIHIDIVNINILSQYIEINILICIPDPANCVGKSTLDNGSCTIECVPQNPCYHDGDPLQEPWCRIRMDLNKLVTIRPTVLGNQHLSQTAAVHALSNASPRIHVFKEAIPLVRHSVKIQMVHHKLVSTNQLASD